MLLIGAHWLDHHGHRFIALEKVNRHLWKLLVRCLAAGILGVASTVIAGYWLERPWLYAWPGSNAMAVPTAILFAAVALALVGLTFLRNGHPK